MTVHRSRTAIAADLRPTGPPREISDVIGVRSSSRIDPAQLAWTFHGYDRTMIDGLLADLDVYDGSPGVAVLHDVWYVPGLVGLFAADGTRIDSTCIRRVLAGRIFPDEPSIVPPTRHRTVDRPLIYVGHPYINHFGHFLTESISRLWYASEDTEAPLLCHDTRGLPGGGGRLHRPRWLRSAHIAGFHELTGIDPDRYISFRSPVLLREVVVPAASLVLGAEAFTRHADLTEAAARRALPERVATTEQPLFLSRARLPRRTRRVADDAALVARLRRAGFAIAYPEQLDLAEQIELVNRHEVVVGLKGSAMHHVLFTTSPESKAVYLMPSHVIPRNFLLVEAIKRSGGAAFIGGLHHEDRADGRTGPDRVRLDLDLALAGLSALGLLDGRS